MSSTLTRESLEQITTDVRGRGRRPLLEQAQPQQRAAILIASALAGDPPTASEMSQVFDACPPELLASLVIATRGERAATLVELVERRRMSPEHEGYALLFASLLVANGEPAPPKLLPVLRKRLLAEVGVEATLALCAAANLTTDPECHKLERDLVPWAPVGSVKKLVADTKRRFADGDPRLALPEKAEGTVISGFTARRVAPKVGRNDPCPCNSGKKYKKCCETKDAARAQDPSPVPGMTRAEWISAGAPNMSVDDVDALGADDFGKVDPARSPTDALIRLLSVILAADRFELVGAVLDELAKRPSLPKGDSLEVLTNDAIVEALRSGASHAAEELAARLPDPTKLPLDLRLSLQFAKLPCLAELEQVARKTLEDPSSEECVALPYALLDHAPALGVLISLGSLSHVSAEEGRTLLDEVEEARVRAGLPGETAGWDILEGFQKLDDEVAEDERQRKQLDAARVEAERQLFDAERRARVAEEKIASLESKLVTADAHISELRGRSDTDLARMLEEELDAKRRLETKNAELRTLVADGVRERGDLCKRIAELEAARAAAPAPPSSRDSVEISSAPISEEEPVSGSVMAPRGLHVPAFDVGALASMKRLPKHVAEDALAVAAALGSGKGWHNVKQMQDIAPPLFSVRLGIHHRMLFRVEADQLSVCDVLPRESLDSQLKRYR